MVLPYSRFASSVFLLLVGCAPPATYNLVVELYSDLQPTVDFAYVEAELSSASDSESVRRQRFEPAALSSVEGVVIADFEGLAAGAWTLRVRLRNRDDGLVAAREVRLLVSGPLVATVLVGRACQGVRCPRAGDDPGAVDCIAGRCFDPACFENPGSCEVLECLQDSDCDPPLAACASARCVQGACLSVVDRGGCGEGEYCDLGFGCRPEPTDLCPADGCDDGIDCTQDACVLGRCDFAPVHATCDADPSGFCDATTGCEYLNLCPAEGCDDGVACTLDACVSGRCEFSADHAGCDAMPRGFCNASTGCEYLDPCPAGGVCEPGEIQDCSACAGGTQTCDRECQWGTCAPPAGAREILCNGIDDDCNAGTSDAACPPDTACSAAACRPQAPRLDSLTPSDMAACSCRDFTAVGAHFRSGVRGFLTSETVPTPAEISTLVFDSSTQLRVPNACAGSGTAVGTVYFQNPDGQRSATRSFTINRSAPVVTSLTPTRVAWGETFCPSFRLERSGGACVGAEWAVGDCMGTTAVGVGGPLTVDVSAPDVATASGSSCLDIGPTTAAPGTYCLWVVNPDGGESSHTGIELVVTE